MLLVRLFVARFAPSPPAAWLDAEIQVGPVEIRIINSWEEPDGLKVLLMGQERLAAFPALSEAGLVQVPEDVRRRIERLVESFINAVAVASHSRRRIASPWPPVAFISESESESSALAATPGIEARSTGVPSAAVSVGRTSTLAVVRERPDGVAILAEALSHDHVVGKFHECWRLFERAFASPPARLVGPLATFLVSGDLGFQQREPDGWLKLRGPATHADKRDDFVTESQVRPVIERMEQACYDLLFNKAKWRSRDADRREVHRPVAGAWGPGEGAFLTQGLPASLRFTVLDPFKAFPFDLASKLDQLPNGWWADFPYEANQVGRGSMNVVRGRCRASTSQNTRCTKVVVEALPQLCSTHLRLVREGKTVRDWEWGNLVEV